MQFIKNHDKSAYWIFVASILIHLVILCVGYSAWDVPFRGRLIQVAFILSCIKILMTYYEKYEWMAMFVLAALAGAAYACSGEKYLVYFVVLIFSAKNVDFKKILNAMLWASLISMIIVTVMSLFGVGGMLVDVRDYGRGSEESRYCFGFDHANNFHGTLWYVVCLALMIYKDRFKAYHYAIIMLINIFLLYFTRSRTGFVLVTLAVMCGLAYRYKNEFFFKKLWIYITGAVFFVFTIVLSLVSVEVHKRKYGVILKTIDKLTTGRIWMSYKCTYMYLWKAFEAAEDSGFTTDNGFVTIPVTYGYVTGIIFVLLIAIVLYVIAKKRDGILFGVVLMAIMYTFMESTYMVNDAYLLANPIYIVAMVLLGGNAYSREKKVKK